MATRADATGLTSSQWNARYGNVAVNTAKATAVTTAVLARFPGTTPGGIYNCRYQRGSTGNPDNWSVHSVAGATDVWPNGSSSAEIIAFAKTLPGVWDAWLDASPGDVHIQVVPNPPSGWVPACAGGPSGGVSAPAGAVVAARALRAAGATYGQALDLTAIAGRESSWNPLVHSFGAGCGPGMCGRPSHTPGAVCEDSWGLWQINWCAHSQTLKDRGISRPQLVVPTINAKAAGIISGGFSDLGPWRGLENVTDTQKAQAAAAVAVAFNAAPGPPHPGRTGTDKLPRTSTLPADCAAKKAGETPTTTGPNSVPLPASGICPPGFVKFGPLCINEQASGGSGTFNPIGGALAPAFDVVKSTADFFVHLPVYLKIAAGGIVMLGGLALVLAGASGNTSKPAQAAQAIVMRTPAGRVIERRRAIGAERTTQRTRSARAEAESRVDESGKVTRLRVYRAQRAAADRAAAAGVEAETGETVDRRVVNFRKRDAS